MFIILWPFNRLHFSPFSRLKLTPNSCCPFLSGSKCPGGICHMAMLMTWALIHEIPALISNSCEQNLTALDWWLAVSWWFPAIAVAELPDFFSPKGTSQISAAHFTPHGIKGDQSESFSLARITHDSIGGLCTTAYCVYRCCWCDSEAWVTSTKGKKNSCHSLQRRGHFGLTLISAVTSSPISLRTFILLTLEFLLDFLVLQI